MRKLTYVALLALSTLLAGCSNKPAADPTPSPEITQRNEQSRLAVSQVGEPIEVDGCQVKVHEVLVTRPGVALDSSFTLATANCPAANVTSTRETCGKSCVHNTVRVDRLSEAELEANAKAQADVVLAQEVARRRKEIDDKIAELQKEHRKEWTPHEVFLARPAVPKCSKNC